MDIKQFILKVSVFRLIFSILAVIIGAFLFIMSPKETLAYSAGRGLMVLGFISQLYQIILYAVVGSRNSGGQK